MLNGQKAVVYAAPWATHLLVTARTGGSQREREGVALFLIDAKLPGVVRRDYPTVDGFQASEIYFENVAIPGDALIAGGIDLIEHLVDEATVAVCGEACGIARKLHEGTLDYTKQRKQFGVPIGKFQVLQHRMADMFIEVEQIASMALMGTLSSICPRPGARPRSAWPRPRCRARSASSGRTRSRRTAASASRRNWRSATSSSAAR